jgi:hypothetical protein
MRWRRKKRSGALIDARGAASGGGGPFGGGVALPGGRIPVGRGGLGIGGIVLLLVIFLAFRACAGASFDIGVPLDGFGSAPVREAPIPPEADPDARLVDFVSFVLDDVQASWADTFQRAGRSYRPAELVLFEGSVSSGCGRATSAVGPFYCPLDERVYLDLDFFRDLRQRFGSPGDFAQAYVIAHEFGHHVQHLLGIDEDVRRAQGEEPDRANELSVRQELQADCLAGVWGFTAEERGLLEAGDLEEALRAAAAIGDDRIQRQSGMRVNPESWTHGSAEQRSRWFRAGFDGGEIAACDTFAGDV